MPILRTIKNEYEFFHHQKLDIIVALDAENKEIVSSFWKNNKGKKQLLNVPVKVKGYKMIKDEEFETLKIDFNEQFQFDAAELSKAKFQ